LIDLARQMEPSLRQAPVVSLKVEDLTHERFQQAREAVRAQLTPEEPDGFIELRYNSLPEFEEVLATHEVARAFESLRDDPQVHVVLLTSAADLTSEAFRRLHPRLQELEILVAPIGELARDSEWGSGTSAQEGGAKAFRAYLEGHQYPGGPIQMIVDAYKRGRQVVVLSDPHPDTSGTTYSQFLEALVDRLSREVGLKKLLIEYHPRAVEEELLPLIREDKETWERFWNFVRTEDPDASSQELFKQHFPSHWLPMLRAADARGVEIFGFDPRGHFGFSGWLREEGLPEEGGKTEERFTEEILNRLDLTDSTERVLVISGPHHVAKTEALKRMGNLLTRNSGLKVTTVLVHIGWRGISLRRHLIPGDHLLSLLRRAKIPVVAVHHTALSPIGNLQVFKEWIIGTLLNAPVEGTPRDRIVARLKDFDMLVYFDSQEAITQYVRAYTKGHQAQDGGRRRFPSPNDPRAVKVAKKALWERRLKYGEESIYSYEMQIGPHRDKGLDNFVRAVEKTRGISLREKRRTPFDRNDPNLLEDVKKRLKEREKKLGKWANAPHFLQKGDYAEMALYNRAFFVEKKFDVELLNRERMPRSFDTLAEARQFIERRIAQGEDFTFTGLNHTLSSDDFRKLLEREKEAGISLILRRQGGLAGFGKYAAKTGTLLWTQAAPKKVDQALRERPWQERLVLLSLFREHDRLKDRTENFLKTKEGRQLVAAIRKEIVQSIKVMVLQTSPKGRLQATRRVLALRQRILSTLEETEKIEDLLGPDEKMILDHLREVKRKMAPSRVVEDLGMSGARVVNAAIRLEQKGFISRNAQGSFSLRKNRALSKDGAERKFLPSPLISSISPSQALLTSP